MGTSRDIGQLLLRPPRTAVSHIILTLHRRHAPNRSSRNTQDVFAGSRFPSELRLLLLCTRWPVGDGAEEIREHVASGDVDWDYFLSLCRHHRVVSLVYRGLSAAAAPVPEPTLAALRAAANENAVSVFRYLSETRRLCDLLEQAGVPVLVLKGVPLSQAVFGDASVRDVGDIDLLIAPQAEETADRILIADNFFRNDPSAPLTPRRRLSWQRHGKDYTYRSNRDDFEIDLHWRLFRNPHMPGNALPPMLAHPAARRASERSASVFAAGPQLSLSLRPWCARWMVALQITRRYRNALAQFPDRAEKSAHG